MGLPKLQTCCFVFDLKTGTQIIGVINAMMTFAMMVMLIAVAAMFGAIQKNPYVMLDPDAEAAATGVYVITIMLAILYVVKFLSDLLFIYGVTVEHKGIIKGYGIVWFVVFMLSSFLFFLHVTDFHGAIIAAKLFYLALNVYAALLAYSFYDQINSREEL